MDVGESESLDLGDLALDEDDIVGDEAIQTDEGMELDLSDVNEEELDLSELFDEDDVKAGGADDSSREQVEITDDELTIDLENLDLDIDLDDDK